MNNPLKIIGAPGSPYSRKLRSLMRYREIPYQWIQKWTPEENKYPKPPIPIIPVVVFPNERGEYDRSVVDSTPLIREFENLYTKKSVLPQDPVFTLLNDVLEALLAEVTQVYIPFLISNEKAFQTGGKSFECKLEGTTWTQNTFSYQVKCLQVLRKAYGQLSVGDKEFLELICPIKDNFFPSAF